MPCTRTQLIVGVSKVEGDLNVSSGAGGLPNNNPRGAVPVSSQPRYKSNMSSSFQDKILSTKIHSWEILNDSDAFVVMTGCRTVSLVGVFCVLQCERSMIHLQYVVHHVGVCSTKYVSRRSNHSKCSYGSNSCDVLILTGWLLRYVSHHLLIMYVSNLYCILHTCVPLDLHHVTNRLSIDEWICWGPWTMIVETEGKSLLNHSFCRNLPATAYRETTGCISPFLKKYEFLKMLLYQNRGHQLTYRMKHFSCFTLKLQSLLLFQAPTTCWHSLIIHLSRTSPWEYRCEDAACAGSLMAMRVEPRRQSLKDDSLSELLASKSSSVFFIPPSGKGASGVLQWAGRKYLDENIERYLEKQK